MKDNFLKIPNYNYVQMSCYLMYKSFNELLNFKYSPFELQKDPFLFHQISLQYMFTMEYCKLLEKDTKNGPFKKGQTWEDVENENFASLYKLSRTILEKEPVRFKNTHDENISTLNIIRVSNFYKKVKEDRNQNYAHSDQKNSNPYGIKLYTLNELNEAESHIKSIKLVLDNCTVDYQYIFDHKDDRTKVFMENYQKYSNFYRKNLFQARKEGFI